MTRKVEAVSALPPGSTVGILGGGQLGRMLSLAAARFGIRVHIFAPEDTGPAAEVSAHHTRAEWDDTHALKTFADSCDVVTYEWENVPVAAAEVIEATSTPLRPGSQALRTAQDRLVEKTDLSQLPGIATAPFKAASEAVQDLRRAVQFVGLPCVVKTRRGGYDGKGQAVLRETADLDAAWEAIGGLDLIVEGFVDFTREVSIIAARGLDGTVQAYPLVENVHRDGILYRSTAPAADDDGRAAELAKTILDALDYVGVIGVEFFDTPNGLLVNEIAPRVHNSGHWTQDAGCVDQFEAHIRAVCGWPLGDMTPRLGVEMTNLLGVEVDAWPGLADADARLHLYGKREARPGRKMGHVNRVTGALQ